MSDTKRIDVAEAVRRLVTLADELRRSGRGHLFVYYSPHVDWLDITLYVPQWSNGAEQAAEGTIEVGDDGTVDARQLDRAIADIEARTAGADTGALTESSNA